MQTVLHSPRFGWKSGLLLALIAMPALAMSAEVRADQGLPRLGLSPGEPQVRSATPTIPFGVQPAQSKEFVLDFHGYILMPASVGMHRRDTTAPAQNTSDQGSSTTTSTTTNDKPVPQSGTVLHSPPVLPQNLRSFEYTAAVPTPWVQLNLTYGNSTVAATAIMSGTTVMDASGQYSSLDQLGVSDAFVTVNLAQAVGFPLQLNVGAFTGRYGAMGTYDAGRYATPLIARTNTIGETITGAYKLGDITFMIEQGLGGQLARPPVGLTPAGWNDFSDDTVGSTLVNHVHAGMAYQNFASLGLHYLTAWTQDDLAKGGGMPDGRITVLGADLRLSARRAGHLYVGGARTTATNATTVSGAIEVLNARGGPELIANYLGPNSNGNGDLTTFGAQYDLSIAKLLYGDLFTGTSSDILVSLFGMNTKIGSRDKDYDGVTKTKGGAEVTYLPCSWFGVSERIDHVRLHGDDTKKAFTSYSSRLLFHTGWKSHDEFSLQYTHFVYGADVQATVGFTPDNRTMVKPDRDVFSLSATFWW